MRPSPGITRKIRLRVRTAVTCNSSRYRRSRASTPNWRASISAGPRSGPSPAISKRAGVEEESDISWTRSENICSSLDHGSVKHTTTKVKEDGERRAVSREQWRLVAAALALGGNVRVGLEDNFYLPDGTMARSNGELVAKARAMTEAAGRRVATVAETRERLGL